MIMDKATAEALIQMRLLEKINEEGKDSKAIKSLPTITREAGIVWARIGTIFP